MKKMRLTILPVGQGTGTLIEILDDADKTIEAIVCDLGGYGWYGDQTSKFSLGLVKQQLEAMTAPALDAVFLSHGDMDHINLMNGLLDAFDAPSTAKPTMKVLTVKNVWHGDEQRYYTKYGVNTLTKLAGYKPTTATTNLHELTRPAFSVDKPLYRSPEGVEVFLITGNTAPSEVPEVEEHEATKTDNSVRNTPSLVLAIAFGDPRQLIVLTGDATALTMAMCRKYFAHFKIPITSVLHITLPHHGSPRTSYALVEARGREGDDDLAQTNVNEFVKAFSPKSASASSGEKFNRLPAAKLINDFCAYAADTAWPDPVLGASGQHFYTAWFEAASCVIPAAEDEEDDEEGMVEDWPTRDGYHSARTTKAFYTTEYLRRPVDATGVPYAFPYAADPEKGPAASTYATDLTIPWATGWAFTIPAKGAPVIQRVDEVTSPPVFAALEARHGPLPRQRFVFLDGADPAVVAAATPPPPAPARVPMPTAPPVRSRPSRIRPVL